MLDRLTPAQAEEIRARCVAFLREGPRAISDLADLLREDPHPWELVPSERITSTVLAGVLRGRLDFVAADHRVSYQPDRLKSADVPTRILRVIEREGRPLGLADVVEGLDPMVRERLGIDESVVVDALDAGMMRGMVNRLPDGAYVAADRSVLPYVSPWRDTGIPYHDGASPLSQNTSLLPGSWETLVSRVAATVRPASFRFAQVTITNGERTVQVAIGVTDLSREVAILSMPKVFPIGADLREFESRGWWFWDARVDAPLDLPALRRYASETEKLRSLRGVHAASEVRRVGEGIVVLARAALQDGPIEIEADVEYGPGTVGGVSASQWAERLSRPVLGKCLRCGADLTDDQSAERGYGPDCYRQVLESFPAESVHLLRPRRWVTAPSAWAYPLTVEEFMARCAD